MDLEKLKIDLESIGTNVYVQVIDGSLCVSINVIENIEVLNQFNGIIINDVTPTYPNTVTIVMEGGSIKAVFN